jgi:hypothetical protein
MVMVYNETKGVGMEYKTICCVKYNGQHLLIAFILTTSSFCKIYLPGSRSTSTYIYTEQIPNHSSRCSAMVHIRVVVDVGACMRR